MVFGDGVTVMVAEDTADVRQLMVMELEARGFNVIEARDGGEAVEIAARKRPDLILLDIQMPGMNGFEAARRIREIDALRGTPIVAFSAYGYGETNRWKALDAGCDEYVNKLEGITRLPEIVARHLHAA